MYIGPCFIRGATKSVQNEIFIVFLIDGFKTTEKIGIFIGFNWSKIPFISIKVITAPKATL